jgi:hypothetical protein
VSTPFRCAAEADLRVEELAGTASTVRAFLLVENPGPWGVDALLDNRLPPAVKTGLAARARDAGVRVNLVRRHHRPAPRSGFRVFAAHAGPASPWLETVTLDHAEQLLELDLASLGAGRSPGLEPSPETLLCVCTHGRHDACCAERGRPVAAALAAEHPDLTWEVSHVGGDRFAANVLVLPQGLYYGALDPASALRVAGATLSGHVVLEHLRGRSRWPMPVQAAEVALRQRLDETRLAAVELAGHRRDGELVTARVTVAGASYDVTVRVGRSAPARLTCRAGRDSAAYTFETVSITDAPA